MMVKVDTKIDAKLPTLILKELTEIIEILQFRCYFKLKKTDVRPCQSRGCPKPLVTKQSPKKVSIQILLHQRLHKRK